MPYLISFASQKGGPGKTTLSILAATYLFSEQSQVVVLDADFPQHSFARHRQRDLHELSQSDPAHRQAQEILLEKGLVPYGISPTKVVDAAQALGIIKTSTDLEFVLVDLPGTLNVTGIDTVLKGLDLVVIPCELEFKSITAAMETMDYLTTLCPTLRLGLIWTKIKKPHQQRYREEVEKAMHKLFNLRFFDYRLPDTVKISQQLSTLVALDMMAAPLVEELLVFLSSPRTAFPHQTTEVDG
jgi:chromosome partitioning protein